MNYKILLFDADETLFDFAKSERYALEHMIQDFGIPYQEKIHLKLYIEVNSAIWKEFESGQITQEKLKTERFARFGKRLGAELDAELCAERYMSHLADASYLLDGAQKVVEELQRSYRIGVVTNGLAAVQDKRVRHSVLQPYFETVVVSEELGIAKPNPGIFEYALKTMGVRDKSTVLMIGDSLTSDIQGGINAGLSTCWVNAHGKEHPASIQPDYEVKHVQELLKILLP